MRIDWKMAGFREIRTASGAVSEVNRIAAGIAQRAGDGFVAEQADTTGGRGRARAAVVATTVPAARAEAKDHVLLKAIGD